MRYTSPERNFIPSPPDIMNIGVLVNTCDRFADCWDLFFHQWCRYRNGIEWPLYLNTEHADYTYPAGISGHALAVCRPRPGYKGWTGEGIPTWSWCVIHALESMPEDVVLYMQEDYFLTRNIDTEKVQELAALMQNNPDIECVHLHTSGNTHNKPSVFSGLRRSSRIDRYYVSCQAALWKKSTLLALLREHENAWQFERWGTNRARVLRCHFYTAAYSGYSPIEYFCTGIVQGKWLHPVEELFETAGIEMDFSKRGFWKKRQGLWQHLKWVVEKIKMRIWPPKSMWSVVRCVFSSDRRSSSE